METQFRGDPVWQFWGYRKALFLFEIVWRDTEKMSTDPRGKALVSQIIRSTGSISANIEEGYGRGLHGKEYIHFLRIALGSARETKGWYWRARRIFSEEIIAHRLQLTDEVIKMLIAEINRQKRRKQMDK